MGQALSTRQLPVSDFIDEVLGMYRVLELSNMFFRESSFQGILELEISQLFQAELVPLRVLFDLVLFILDDGHHILKLINRVCLYHFRQV